MIKPKISWMPKYDINAASSRIRVFYPHTTINTFFNNIAESYIGTTLKTNVLFIQKNLQHNTIHLAKTFSGLRIFDYDDIIEKHELHAFQHMLQNIDIVSVDTPERLLQFKREYPFFTKPIICLPDCIDYNLAQPMECTTQNKLVWYGNYPNFTSMLWTLPIIANSSYKTLTTITDINGINKFKCRNILPIQWNLHTFIKNMRENGICILTHKDLDQAKSNNKMLAAITMGIPCIVGFSKSYIELAKEFELNEAIIESEQQLRNALEFFTVIDNRKKYLAHIQPSIFNRFNCKTLTQNFINILKGYL